MKISVPLSSLVGTMVCVLFSCFTSQAQNIDFGKSYINVTKGLNGGTVEPGDTLEIRAAFVVKSGTYDSCGYFDVVPVGTSYIPGTIRVLTNEGKIYKQFTDAIPDDAGFINGANIRINLGFNPAGAPATAVRRGRIINTHKPSFYGNTCIMIASFRVKVTAAYNSNISIGGGSMSYRPSGGLLTNYTFPGRAIAVYKNFGICPNAVGANSLGTEFNGTFGTGKPRNRGTSANVPTGYTYNIFGASTPNDYFYGISNNTSINTGYTTVNTWPTPDNAHRVFSVWDIIGDHTGAVSPTAGNPPADTVANPNGGYMLVINAAYKIDSAFQQTITNICPNTYYEISAWVRNICPKCGCDSNGVGATGGVGYIPTAVKDSSGVYPNLTFNLNGVDYYSTGNVTYSGKWIKKGFTVLTGPAQTSFTLKFFNNAPGGGGNDWALDDISVATCSPNMAFTPTNNPTICDGNVVDIGAYIRSFFNNYTYFRWQKSVDNGLTWSNATAVGTGTPVWNGTAYEYFTPYPPFVASLADSGTKFRVVVASTLSNITNPNCTFTDVASILTLNVIDCGAPLATNILSFTGKIEMGLSRLNWTTNREEGPLDYVIERSTDGRNYSAAATLKGYNNTDEINNYQWSEPNIINQVTYYRIRLMAPNRQKISRIVKLSATGEELNFINVLNPFKNILTTEINAPNAQVIRLQLVDISGKIIRQQQYTLVAGNNILQMSTESLPKGMYTLQLVTATGAASRKVLKQ